MRRPRALIGVTLVATLLGLLLVLQLRAQGAAGGLEALSAQDLTTLIASVNDRNATLRAEADALASELRSVSSSSQSGQSNIGQLASDLRRLRLWAGLESITGRGVVVDIAGPVTAGAVNDLLDELRLAGAEALAVETVRVVPGVVVAGSPGALSVDGVALDQDVRISAIGKPQALQAILERPGGIVSRIAVGQLDVVVEITPTEAPLQLPGTTRDLVPAGASPRI